MPRVLVDEQVALGVDRPFKERFNARFKARNVVLVADDEERRDAQASEPLVTKKRQFGDADGL